MIQHKELDPKGNLRPFALLLSGGALFSMHFGASSMVWPMNWGKESGTSLFLAFGGAFITSLLLVVVGYIALARFNGTYGNMAKSVAGRRFGTFFTSLTILVIGPFYVIPRMSAAAWDSITQVFSLTIDTKIPIVLFTVVFYAVTYFFLISPGKAMDRISKLLFPILIIIVAAIIGRGLISPLGEMTSKTYSISPFAYGFTNGYATAEVLCALIFGSVIFNSLRSKGIAENKLTSNMIRVGICGVGILMVTHFCHMVIGATSAQIFPDLSYTMLYTAVTTELYGRLGGVFFCGVLIMAALTTAIGMTSGRAEVFVDSSGNRLKYSKISLTIVLLSIVFGSLGLADILTYLGPVLDGIYPAVIVLVMYFAAVKDWNDPLTLAAAKWAFFCAFIMGMIDMLWKYFVIFDIFRDICGVYEKIPLAESSLVWMPLTLLVFLIRLLSGKKKAA
ncbi:MAG: branched-chain amino acid transport system II carrier protein [Spirochaetia bacterium]|nr:branched-chain amino acid transport system II carrier protein [Spirochaetia bacterium]